MSSSPYAKNVLLTDPKPFVELQLHTPWQRVRVRLVVEEWRWDPLKGTDRMINIIIALERRRFSSVRIGLQQQYEEYRPCDRREQRKASHRGKKCVGMTTKYVHLLSGTEDFIFLKGEDVEI